MSIQVYSCGEDGDFEIFSKTMKSVSPTETCPTCKKDSPHVFRPGGRVNVEQDWNERANDEQKNELTMVTASQEAHERTSRERGTSFAPKNKDSLYKVALKLEQNKRNNVGNRRKS